METTILSFTHGTMTKEGSLDVAPLDFDLLEIESTIAYHEAMIERCKEDKLGGQVLFHKNQLIIAKKMLSLQSAGFPEVLDVRSVEPRRGNEFGHGKIRALSNQEKGILVPKFRYYAAFSPGSYTGTNNKSVPIIALESYQRAKAIPDLFDSFEIWERAKNRNDAGKRVGEHRVRPPVEIDPYLVGVVRFAREVKERMSYSNYRTTKIDIVPPRYFLIDRWDEIDPMP